MPRTFKLTIYKDGQHRYTIQKKASDHRAAVMLVVQQRALTQAYEVDVEEVMYLPKSTYRVFKHTSYQIEQKT